MDNFLGKIKTKILKNEQTLKFGLKIAGMLVLGKVAMSLKAYFFDKYLRRNITVREIGLYQYFFQIARRIISYIFGASNDNSQELWIPGQLPPVSLVVDILKAIVKDLMFVGRGKRYQVLYKNLP